MSIIKLSKKMLRAVVGGIDQLKKPSKKDPALTPSTPPHLPLQSWDCHRPNCAHPIVSAYAAPSKNPIAAPIRHHVV